MVIKMIKIIHVLTDTNIGGAGIWLLNYLKSYDREQFDVSVALPENSQLTPKAEALNVKVHEVRYIEDKSYSKQGTKELIKLFNKEKPQIIHSHASLSARIAAKKLGIKIVNTRHCLEDAKSGVKKLIYGAINNYLSDIVIGVSKAACENLIKDGTKENKVKLVYNGVYPLKKLSEEERIKIRERLNIPSADTVVGIVARLEDVKNHEMFLKAAVLILKIKKDVTFVVVGDGTIKEQLKSRAKELGIDEKVIFTGYMRDTTEVMNVIDINTITSHKEALSLALIEGMSIEKPGIATASGGTCEVIEHGVSGYIVENNNAEAFSEAVLSLIDDGEKRVRMGESGKERAEKLFGIEQMINTLEGIYKELV